MNRPSCYGTTTKRSPYYRNHQCMNCLYILDCIGKENMLKQTKANPSCYGTQPKSNTDLWVTRRCATCTSLEGCSGKTYNIPEGASAPLTYSDHLLAVSKGLAEPVTDPNIIANAGKGILRAMVDSIDEAAVNARRAETLMGTLGTKLDNDKLRWSLLPSGTIAQVIAVLEYGAKKYSVGNWVNVPDGKTRYYDAAMRHIDAWRGGELNDSESGLPHLAHAACCILFLLWFDGKSVS